MGNRKIVYAKINEEKSKWRNQKQIKKERQESKPKYRDRADILEEYARHIRNGEKVGVADLLESLVSDLMR
jgi:hypothetical protein